MVNGIVAGRPEVAHRQAHLATYEWGRRFARLTSAGIARASRAAILEVLGGDFASVNLNCLDDIDPISSLLHWDGRHDNWHAAHIRRRGRSRGGTSGDEAATQAA
jgi:hypothetical protein